MEINRNWFFRYIPFLTTLWATHLQEVQERKRLQHNAHIHLLRPTPSIPNMALREPVTPMRNEPVTRMVDQGEKPMVLAEMALRAKATALKRSLSQPRLVAAPKPPVHSRSQKGEGIRMPEERLESQRERGTTASPVSVSGILQEFRRLEHCFFLRGKQGSMRLGLNPKQVDFNFNHQVPSVVCKFM